jgi:DNA (cytosine-5)-methyltransferase 1
MRKLKVLDLFSGIGGFSLGLERTGGFETVAFCEIEDYPRKVLAKHWPDVPIYNDVRELTSDRLRQDGIAVDVITGGFPCQDISLAGNQAGIGEGTRSGLWSECARLLGDIRPRYAIFENVTALLSGDNGRWFEQVLWDISQVGYDAEWHCIPASELGAHHHRDRVWIISYPQGIRQQSGKGCRRYGEWGQFLEGAGPRRDPIDLRYTDRKDVPNPNGQGLQRVLTARALQGWKETTGYSGQDGESPGWSWATEPDICRVANGVPQRSHRLKALGNAVVPQIPELIGKAILRAEIDQLNKNRRTTMGSYICLHCDEMKESHNDGYRRVPGQKKHHADPYCDSCFDSLECDWCGDGFEDDSSMINHNGRLFHDKRCLERWQKDLRG